MKETRQPPPLPGEACGQAVDALLPPGVDGAPAASPPMASASIPLVKGGLSPEEKAQWRFWKNAIVFGVSVVALIVVCYWMTR